MRELGLQIEGWLVTHILPLSHTHNVQPVDLTDLGAAGHMAFKVPLVGRSVKFYQILFAPTETNRIKRFFYYLTS